MASSASIRDVSALAIEILDCGDARPRQPFSS